MSSTTHPKRAGPDAYFTPDAVARACVATLGNLRGLTVWEPHAGGGAYVRALSDAYATVYASDIDPRHLGLWRGAAIREVGDFLTMGVPGHPEWVVGNPPFNRAEAHVRRALDVASIGVGFLLRLAFLESMRRAPLWREHPPAEVHVLMRRPSFTGGGTDSAAYAWFVWRVGYVGRPVMYWLEVTNG